MSAFLRVLSPLVSLLVSLCCMVCPPSRWFCLPLSPLVPSYTFLFPFVGWCVRLLGGLVSPCLPFPSCFPLLDGVSAFPRVLSPLVSPLSPFLLPFVGWCVRLPEGLVSPCGLLSPLCPFVSPCVTYLPVGWCARLP